MYLVSSAGERENEFQGQIHALRKENEQLMRQASISKKRMKKRLDQNNKSAHSVVTKLPIKRHPSKLKPQSRLLTINEPIITSKKRNRSEDFDKLESSTSTRIDKAKSPSPTSVSTEVQQQPPSPPKISNNKRRKRNATVETYREQQQQQQQQQQPTIAVSSTSYNSSYQQTIDQNIVASVDHQTIPNYQQQQIVSSQRHRFNSHQPTTSNMVHQQRQHNISPVVSRHNSLTLNDQTTTFDFNNNTTATPNQFSIIHSPFGNEHIFFNTFDNFDNVVSAIPALTTPSIGNNVHLNTPTSASSASSATSTTNYDNHLDLFHSIMQSQDPTTDSKFFFFFCLFILFDVVLILYNRSIISMALN